MTKILLVLFGIIFILAGVFGFIMMVIYAGTQNTRHNYLFLVCLAVIAIGFLILYKASGINGKE